MRPQDDTQFKTDYTQFTSSNTESAPREETAKNNNMRAAKIAAGVGAAAIAGTGAAYAANEYFNGEEVAADTAAPASQPAPAAQPAAPATHQAAPAAQPAPKAQHTTQHTEAKPGDDTVDPKFLKENDVEISSIETQTTDDGETVHLATGTVDGHQAIFVDDGAGKVQAAVIDLNDNGNIDEGEVIDMKGSNVTMRNLAGHLDTTPETETVTPKPVVNDEPEVKVIEVQNNVDMEGQTVDVAVVAVNDEPVVFVDTTQNGEVDVAVADVDHSGSITDNEVVDVSDSHIPMPTVNDVAPQTDMVQNEMPDYSNDADITTYEV